MNHFWIQRASLHGHTLVYQTRFTTVSLDIRFRLLLNSFRYPTEIRLRVTNTQTKYDYQLL